MLQQYTKQAVLAMQELLAVANVQAGGVVVVGCSTSEIAGKQIGTHPGPAIADALITGFMRVLDEKEIFLAGQCCEHLNRAIVVEKQFCTKHGLEQVNALPQPTAGGSFAAALWNRMQAPVLVEFIKADAGLDIGNTLIGMHLRHVAVPVRLSIQKIGQAQLVAARTRHKFVGGERAIYQQNLL